MAKMDALKFGDNLEQYQKGLEKTIPSALISDKDVLDKKEKLLNKAKGHFDNEKLKEILSVQQRAADAFARQERRKYEQTKQELLNKIAKFEKDLAGFRYVAEFLVAFYKMHSGFPKDFLQKEEIKEIIHDAEARYLLTINQRLRNKESERDRKRTLENITQDILDSIETSRQQMEAVDITSFVSLPDFEDWLNKIQPIIPKKMRNLPAAVEFFDLQRPYVEKLRNLLRQVLDINQYISEMRIKIMTAEDKNGQLDIEGLIGQGESIAGKVKSVRASALAENMVEHLGQWPDAKINEIQASLTGLLSVCRKQFYVLARLPDFMRLYLDKKKYQIQQDGKKLEEYRERSLTQIKIQKIKDALVDVSKKTSETKDKQKLSEVRKEAEATRSRIMSLKDKLAQSALLNFLEENLGDIELRKTDLEIEEIRASTRDLTSKIAGLSDQKDADELKPQIDELIQRVLDLPVSTEKTALKRSLEQAKKDIAKIEEKLEKEKRLSSVKNNINRCLRILKSAKPREIEAFILLPGHKENPYVAAVKRCEELVEDNSAYVLEVVRRIFEIVAGKLGKEEVFTERLYVLLITACEKYGQEDPAVALGILEAIITKLRSKQIEPPDNLSDLKAYLLKLRDTRPNGFLDVS